MQRERKREREREREKERKRKGVKEGKSIYIDIYKYLYI